MVMPYPQDIQSCGHRAWHWWRVVIVAVLLGLTGCAAVGPDYVPPTTALPEQWHSVSANATGSPDLTVEEWWQCLKDNDTVEASQPLAYLDDAKYKAAVMKSRAEVASAKANYQEALATRHANQKTLARYRKTRELTGGKLPSLEDLEQAEADLERAIAAVQAAVAAIDIASAALKENETELKKTVIYAPISGVVLSRDMEPGQTMAASLEAPVLYTLAEDLRHMELQVDVDEADVGAVKDGQQATFSVDAYPNRIFSATITQVRFGAEETDGVVTYKTVLKVENPDLLLRPGMTATANIIVQRDEKQLLVPNTALRFTPPQPPAIQADKKSLLGRLMPGPPPHNAPKKTAARQVRRIHPEVLKNRPRCGC